MPSNSPVSGCANVVRRMFEPARPRTQPQTIAVTLKAWWQACRPPFLIVDIIPIGLALILASRAEDSTLLPFEQWAWGRFAAILLACFMVHTVANIANDLFDYALGTDTNDTIGGSRVIQQGTISPRAITLAMCVLSLGALAIGLKLIAVSGQTWLYGILLFSLCSAIFYVAPPVKYGYRGYGELSVGINMGLIMVCGAHAVLADAFSKATLPFGLTVGLMVAGILYYQSLPEIVTDQAAGKMTLAVRLGKARAELLFRLWWPAVWTLIVVLWAADMVGWIALLGLFSFPLYWAACQRIRTTIDWLELDAYGHLVRKLYLLNGLALLLGTAWRA